jgi:hypothetical protein
VENEYRRTNLGKLRGSVALMTQQGPSPSTLQRLVAMFRGAMVTLGKSPSEQDLERWAVLIHSSMSGRGRSYHTVEHVFTVDGAPTKTDAIGTLAILFHDTVYCEVDGGLPRGLQGPLSDALSVDGGRVELRPFDPEQDPLRALVARIFGFTPGQSVTFQSGLNELASALLAVRALQSHLTLPELALVVTCIEGTIPFRPQDAEERLYERLVEADEEHGLGLGPEEAERAVQRAVSVSNADVGNFAYEDAGAFLSHTWELIPETNPTLRLPAYTLSEYRQAMKRMAGFFKMVEAERVFRTFRGEPSGEVFEEMLRVARINIDRGHRYLLEKLLAARVLEALAAETGGDAPVSLFMGDLPNERPGALRLEDLLKPARCTADDADPEVFRLLLEGRNRESGFDLKTSPLAARLYGLMGDAASDRALDTEGTGPLLKTLPGELLAEIARACGTVSVTRTEAIETLLASLAL